MTKRRRVREAQDELRREQLRQAVLQLLAPYDCQIQQGGDWIEVRGRPQACPFRIDLPGDLALLGAGVEGEYVSEWVLSTPADQADLAVFLQRLVDGDLDDLPLGLNDVRLEGYRGCARLLPRGGSS
ncbi:hypothetical protein [Geodermatophilus dictyosporus]|uniref:hypothetical protein n=1 Tax=Geodermatophilus dictyosporus TaxID=1523247 RepID=UPI0010AA586A|nr:hypothetical protein [Geodermatophilus dictyosporus]